jgi:LuxR family maltose regulon positive regulatory protein
MTDSIAWLITTKLHAPPLREHLVLRPRLAARVAAGLAGPLTLIAAPAGFGKTSLAAAALADWRGKTAWLSLDEGDNDGAHFLAYLLAALRAGGAFVGMQTVELLGGPQPAPPPMILAQVINHIAEAPDPLALVLDDYHVIRAAAVHDMVSFLLEHAPPLLHLVVITRADPPLPLPRLRARGQLVELRAADLRFTPAEAAAFLNETMRLGLPADLAALLAERTEGWIAGLQLAALRLAGQQAAPAGDAAAFVRAFSGTQRYILDYLLEEVLQQQPPAVQRFLLLTSPLSRLCGPLCDAVMQAAGDFAPDAAPASAALLAALERANVFLVPLDDERRWYRYHHLFADLLRARLREWQPALEPRLNAAAAGWLEAHGCIAEAVDTALAAGDPLRAARLVEQNTVGLLARGELTALLSWISVLPLEVRRRRPALCIQQAYALAFAGQLGEAAAALDVAEQAGAEQTAAEDARPPGGGSADECITSANRPPPGGRVAGAAAAVRAMLAVMSGGEDKAISLAEVALALLPPTALWDRAAACWALGYARRSLGDPDAARLCFAEQVRLARAMGNVWTLVTGLTDLALTLRTQGELDQARAVLEEALHAAGEQGARSLGYIARMETALADILCEQGELDAAEQLLAAAFAHVGRWPNPNHVVYAHLTAARLQAARGNKAGALAALQQARAAYQSAPVINTLRRQVETAIVCLDHDLAQDDAFPGRTPNAQAQAHAVPTTAPAELVEPLSAREREVLALLAQGLTNQEIAAQLIVATGTVKAHTSAIYRKLDAANRTEAAARARQLGLL